MFCNVGMVYIFELMNYLIYFSYNLKKLCKLFSELRRHAQIFWLMGGAWTLVTSAVKFRRKMYFSFKARIIKLQLDVGIFILIWAHSYFFFQPYATNVKFLLRLIKNVISWKRIFWHVTLSTDRYKCTCIK